MSIYFCRWPNGDISLVSGNNRLAIDDVLDEVGNPDGAEMIRINHPAAVHLRLKTDVPRRETITQYLAFEGLDEQSYWELCDAYPVLRDALRKEDATEEEISAALQREKERVDKGPADLSDDPVVAMIQLGTDTPKRLAEHYKDGAKANARKKG
jgi:hypothetical protein